jgi:phosphate transport system ATP-binding protein
MTDPLIAVRNLYLTYADETEALRNVSLDIHRNQVFVLFGPSRAGKSTLLRLFNRLSDLIEGTQRRGEVLLAGRDIFAPAVNVSALRRRVSMVFAVPTPLPGSIYANITYGLKLAGIRSEEELGRRVERSLRQAALWDEVKDRLESSAFALSGGQKQRLCIARSLALEPEVILLDNPDVGAGPDLHGDGGGIALRTQGALHDRDGAPQRAAGGARRRQRCVPARRRVDRGRPGRAHVRASAGQAHGGLHHGAVWVRALSADGADGADVHSAWSAYSAYSA